MFLQLSLNVEKREQTFKSEINFVKDNFVREEKQDEPNALERRKGVGGGGGGGEGGRERERERERFNCVCSAINLYGYINAREKERGREREREDGYLNM